MRRRFHFPTRPDCLDHVRLLEVALPTLQRTAQPLVLANNVTTQASGSVISNVTTFAELSSALTTANANPAATTTITLASGTYPLTTSLPTLAVNTRPCAAHHLERTAQVLDARPELRPDLTLLLIKSPTGKCP
ncbi:MAG: hypothetical protein IPP19_17155 [Verrucomicrobia bacterium]|nr:hypothetical protein [Verrucomicrobiota bacterium]